MCIGLFPGDDMGFRTATLVSPKALRTYTLPWHKRFAAMAHERGLVYCLHSCGNLATIMEDLIDDVKIDAKHSYEDVIIPVEDFQARYGSRIGVIGGLDVDRLAAGTPDTGARPGAPIDRNLRRPRALRPRLRQLDPQLHPGGELPGDGGRGVELVWTSVAQATAGSASPSATITPSPKAHAA